MRIHVVDPFEDDNDRWLVAFFRIRGYGERRSRREAAKLIRRPSQEV